VGLFNKLKEILFDEETVEIPVITKEDRKEEDKRKKESKKEVREHLSSTSDDEVVIHKIETPARRVESIEEDLFEMPKLKDDKKEVETKLEPKKQPKTFTFPVFDDDSILEAKNEKKEERRKTSRSEQKNLETPRQKPQEKSKKPSGYTNAFDYSYGKYKGDYKANRESSQSVLKTTLNTKEERKNFTPSPIISPVYGVLNENYKKEDILTKTEKSNSFQSSPLDLDSVRRKAYGTLEDEIELSLTQTNEVPIVETPEEKEYLNDDEGLSINDLLVDSKEELEPTIEEIDDTEIFDDIEEETIEGDEFIQDEIEIEQEEKGTESPEPKEEKAKIERKQLKNSRTYSDEVRDEVKKEKTEDTNEPLGEEDLFDLIDSLYQGKGED